MSPALRRAIVVDQIPFVRLGVTRVLDTEDLEVVAEFGEIRSAIAAAEIEKIDLFVLGHFDDIALVPAVKRIRKAHADASIIVLVASIDGETYSALEKIGLEGLLLRSTTGKDFSDALRSIKSGEKPMSPSLVRLVMSESTPTSKSEDDRGGLTRKELAVLRLIAANRSNKQIAEDMFVTTATVKTHLAHIYRKLNVRGRHEAVSRALALGLLG